MILFINTASSEIITLALLNKKGEILAKKNIPAKYKQSEKLLVGIDKLIGGQKNLKKLTGIIAVKGPGSFTALRIGLTTANTMAFGLKIPVVGVTDGELGKIVKEGLEKLKGSIKGRLNQRSVKEGMVKLGKAKVGSYVMPEYGLEPNITIKRDKQ